MGKKWRYGVILDAGSSGTRLHIYRWKDPYRVLRDADDEDLASLPKLVTKKHWTMKIRPGVSTFGEKPTEVGPDHLQSLIDHALAFVPEDQVPDTPIFLMATAGMRLLPKAQQTTLTHEICSYLQRKTEFSLPDCGLHVQVIPGETEGLYGWLASNYLLGGFDHPELHNHGKGHNTYGFLDMGGASAQIAFAPNSTEAERHADDLKLLRLRTLNGDAKEFRVFTATWLGFGVNQARESYVKALLEAHAAPGVDEIPDPCMPKGLQTTVEGDIRGPDSDGLTLLGTGNFNECLRKTYPLLGKDVPCNDNPCLLNGQHVPAIDFDVNHFIGVSEYWHTTHGVFDTGGDKAYDFGTYQSKVEQYCSQSWSAVESEVKPGKHDGLKIAQEACFKASWLINVLHEGIGVPRIGLEHAPSPGVNVSQGALESAESKGFSDPFQPVDKVAGIEVSWTLGKMLLYAAGQVPPKSKDDSLPVGFGSNVAGTPSDFQFAGSSWRHIEGGNGAGDDDDWDDKAGELIGKARSNAGAGFVGLLLLLLLVAYFFRKTERRLRLFSTLGSLVRRPRRPGSPKRGGRPFSGLASRLFGGRPATYERVLEEGDAEQFDLGGSDSDDTERSDNNSEAVRLGHSSGLATPKLNLDMFELAPAGSSIDRSGLVVRTESRERLAPTVQMLGAGRRSRTGSPTRLKSPFKPPAEKE